MKSLGEATVERWKEVSVMWEGRRALEAEWTQKAKRLRRVRIRDGLVGEEVVGVGVLV
jgi:hypothetical protein